MASVLKQNALIEQGEYPRAVAFNMEDVQAKARDYLAEVQQQADKIIEDAKAEAARIQQQARETGAAEAKKQFDEQVAQESRRLSDQKCKTALVACQKTVDELVDVTSEWLAVWRNQTVELAGMMAERLTRKAMDDESELLRVWLEEALVAMRESRELRVLVHPDDFSVAGRFLQSLVKTVPQAAAVEVMPDPSINPGGCVVRSSDGQFDQQLSSQLDRLIEQLK